ncbi:NAD-dependent epimerase/dehydratase family protein [Albibacterium bauzanense]|uniref:Nucleoside-diphosphate-sugar epimerase n=1 Tax=Albibacterium bauzanense TaxID=653929 RepID=A0A4R1M7A0_9SPHI|nr:NAD(P)-dependent oxidoreductase [Albibacterium bauzanense]TCK85709.1 nucleoside-diphosphate-sugar epimerase [Albibacterium bauzanense]
MRKKILITGASGFVGYHLIAEALQNGLEVYAAIRPNSKIEHLSHFNINYIHLNYTSVEDLKKEIEGKKYNYIIHAAGITKAKTLADYNQINAEFSRNLALAASQVSVPIEKFVLVSSLAALGPIQDLSTLIQDNSIPNPVTSYGWSKLLAEQYLLEIPNLPLVIIRPTAVYGPREHDLYVIFKAINQGLDPYIGKFSQQLSFIYVKDLAKALVKVLSIASTNNMYNITDGVVYNRYALADAAKSILGKKAFRVHLPIFMVTGLAILMDRWYSNRKDTPVLNKEKMNELTAVNWACDISKIQRDLNFVPQYSLKEGVSETLNWYKESKWL